MSRQKPIEVITPPNVLKAKLGGALPAIDEKAIARAEAALNTLSAQFADWILEEMANLNTAWEKYEAAGGGDAATLELHRRAHDLKGLAPTYGYPLVGRICSSLCKLTGEDAATAGVVAPKALLKAHVNAVKAIVVGKIKDPAHPVGLELTTELEERTRTLMAGTAG
jgi:hypothetical protein